MIAAADAAGCGRPRRAAIPGIDGPHQAAVQSERRSLIVLGAQTHGDKVAGRRWPPTDGELCSKRTGANGLEQRQLGRR